MWNVTVFLCIVWALSLLYGEWFAFLLPSLLTCSWPHLQRSSSSLNGVNPSSNYVKIAVITDPQIMDRTTLPLAPRSLVLEIAEFYTDLYMRRAFLSSILPFDPDVILFLGDYFDGGYRLSDEDWEESMVRFKHIFNLNMLKKTSNIKVYYISGNHDIGYAAYNSLNPEIVRRYEKEFGVRNFKITIGKVDFIAIDAQTLDGHPLGNLTSASWDFVKYISKDSDSTPRVLLSHIPLYRPDWTPCGPHRYSPVINQRIHRTDKDAEITYQNYITKNSSTDLLDLIKPALVLSGHDHDQCTVTHMSKHGPVSELIGRITQHTVGTVSWQQGNFYPSFMLLSASNSTLSEDGSPPEDVIHTRLCFLPTQLYIYIWYLSLFAMTLVIVLAWPANEVVILRKLGDLVGNIRSVFNFFSNNTKEKNEDEIYEYEEIWDAEGSMHLIKKTSKHFNTLVNESNSTERSNAVMRSKARKQMGADIDASTIPDISINLGLPARANKSRGRMIIWRLLRALRAIITIAAFNIPIYVFLLFKDWIDK